MKINRNDPCPCKSGKKYKQCCIKKPADNVIPIRAPLANPLEFHNQDFSFSSLMDDEGMEEEGLFDDMWFEEDWDEDDWEDDANEEYEENLMDRLFESLHNGEEPDEEFQEELEDYLEENPEFFMDILDTMQGIREMSLEREPHIKAYNKARKLHQEILNGMLAYYERGKFTQKLEIVPKEKEFCKLEKQEELIFLESSFDLDEIPQQNAFIDLMIYKHHPQMNCLTDEFINQKRYKKLEKVAFLESMRDSYLGLFEVLKIDPVDAYLDLRNVFTGEMIRIIDIGLSGSPGIEGIYIYTRMINYQGMTFGTGLNFFFDKQNPFIRDFIKREKKKFESKDEFKRFFELYNQFKDTFADEEGVEEMGVREINEEEDNYEQLRFNDTDLPEEVTDESMGAINYRDKKLSTKKEEANLEEWRQLYEVATRIKELKPWELFWDMDLIQVKEEKDEHEAYASILGKGGGCYGIVMYEGLSGLNSFLMLAMQESLNLSPEFAMFSQNALTCYWGNRDELKESERKIIKELGHKYRGKNQWLYFRAYNDAFYADSFDKSEVRRMTHYFTLLERAIKFYNLKDVDVDFSDGGCYSFTYDEERKSFTAGEKALPMTMYQYGGIHIVDEDLIDILKQAKRTNQILDVEVTFLGTGVKDDETKRPMNPKLCLVADGKTGLMLATDMLGAGEEVAVELASRLISFILSNGAPKEIRVTNVIVESYVKSVCEVCGIKLRRVMRLPNIEDFVDGLKRFHQ